MSLGKTTEFDKLRLGRCKGKSELSQTLAQGRLIVIYDIPSTKGNLVQDKRFYAELKKDREMNRRKYGRPMPGKGRAKRTISPNKPLYDIPVNIRPIDVYDRFVQEVRP